MLCVCLCVCVCVCRGFPVDKYKGDQFGLIAAFWAIGLHIGRPLVNQNDYNQVLGTLFHTPREDTHPPTSIGPRHAHVDKAQAQLRSCSASTPLNSCGL